MIAPGRAQRPGAARGELEPPTAEELDTCPFCEGREERTPPEVLALPAREPADSPGWRVRVVPNLYPAFERQEVVVHSPRHVTSFADLSDDEIDLVAAAWQARWSAALDRGFAYVHALVNEGREAGASLSHSHSQLVWLRNAPPAVAGEDTVAGLAMMKRELLHGSRVVAERDSVALVCPAASRVPYELLIAPVDHDEDAFLSPLLPAALCLAAEGIRRLRELEGAIPINAWVHDSGFWHIEVVPRLTVFAGVELGAGIYVNVLPPEKAAARLREAGV